MLTYLALALSRDKVRPASCLPMHRGCSIGATDETKVEEFTCPDDMLFKQGIPCKSNFMTLFVSTRRSSYLKERRDSHPQQSWCAMRQNWTSLWTVTGTQNWSHPKPFHVHQLFFATASVPLALNFASPNRCFSMYIWRTTHGGLSIFTF